MGFLIDGEHDGDDDGNGDIDVDDDDFGEVDCEFLFCSTLFQTC